MFRQVPMVGVREARLGPQGARQDRHPCASLPTSGTTTTPGSRTPVGSGNWPLSSNH